MGLFRKMVGPSNSSNVTLCSCIIYTYPHFVSTLCQTVTYTPGSSAFPDPEREKITVKHHHPLKQATLAIKSSISCAICCLNCFVKNYIYGSWQNRPQNNERIYNVTTMSTSNMMKASTWRSGHGLFLTIYWQVQNHVAGGLHLIASPEHLKSNLIFF